MRKIEAAVNKSILNRTPMRQGNTHTEFCDRRGIMEVFLHGNHIATHHYGTGVTEPNLYTLDRWPTRTTQSRLSALGLKIRQQNRVIYLDGEPVCHL